jgi:integrase
MFMTMARTGIRLGEAFGLQWQDVDLERREIRIARGISAGRVETPKSGKARSVDLSKALRDVLERHDAASKAAALRAGKERQPWVFPSLDGTPLDRANVEKAFKRALKGAGLPLHFTPHSLRHTYASLLLQDGVSPAYVQEQLGHSSIKLTVDTYGRWLRKKAPGAVDRLDEAPAAESGSKVVVIGDRPRHPSQQVCWWGWWTARGSNSRPPDCE